MIHCYITSLRLLYQLHISVWFTPYIKLHMHNTQFAQHNQLHGNHTFSRMSVLLEKRRGLSYQKRWSQNICMVAVYKFVFSQLLFFHVTFVCASSHSCFHTVYLSARKGFDPYGGNNLYWPNELPKAYSPWLFYDAEKLVHFELIKTIPHFPFLVII